MLRDALLRNAPQHEAGSSKRAERYRPPFFSASKLSAFAT